MNAVLTLLLMLPFLAPILLANLAEKERNTRAFAFVYLVLLGGALILVGASSMVTGAMLADEALVDALAQQTQGLDVAQLRNARLDLAGLVLMLTAVLSLVALVPAVRRLAARVLPMQADNVVHATALSLTITTFGLNLFQMIALSPALFALAGSDEGVRQLQQAGGVSYLDILVFPLLTFIFAALLGVGLYVRRTQDEALQRLGLTMVTPRQLALSVGVTAGLIALAVATEQVWRAVDPVGLRQVGGVSQALLGDMDNPLGALAIGISAAIGEEMFFRGAHQPRMGIPLATLLFASFHVQYGITPATLLVLVIGLVLAVLRQRTSLTVCILVHFLYNFVSVLLP
jgi:membrane protease YdiL (CAAX protease family)